MFLFVKNLTLVQNKMSHLQALKSQFLIQINKEHEKICEKIDVVRLQLDSELSFVVHAFRFHRMRETSVAPGALFSLVH